MEPVISGGGEDPISTGAASQVMARGRQASHGQSTLTDALASLACCPSSMPSLLVSTNSFCLENTRAGHKATIAHQSTGWRASACEDVVRTRTDGLSAPPPAVGNHAAVVG